MKNPLGRVSHFQLLQSVLIEIPNGYYKTLKFLMLYFAISNVINVDINFPMFRRFKTH